MLLIRLIMAFLVFLAASTPTRLIASKRHRFFGRPLPTQQSSQQLHPVCSPPSRNSLPSKTESHTARLARLATRLDTRIPTVANTAARSQRSFEDNAGVSMKQLGKTPCVAIRPICVTGSGVQKFERHDRGPTLSTTPSTPRIILPVK